MLCHPAYCIKGKIKDIHKRFCLFMSKVLLYSLVLDLVTTVFLVDFFCVLTYERGAYIVSSVELDKQSFCDLKVANNTEHHVAFKVTV